MMPGTHHLQTLISNASLPMKNLRYAVVFLLGLGYYYLKGIVKSCMTSSTRDMAHKFPILSFQHIEVKLQAFGFYDV